jgi:hypothetical protein
VINFRFLFSFHMFTVKRLHRHTDRPTKSQVLSMLNMLPPPPSLSPTKFSHLGGCYYFSHLSVPILLTGIQKQFQCKVSCSGTQYSSYFCKAVTHSESDQARRCLPSLTRLNAHTHSQYATIPRSYFLYKSRNLLK